MNYIIADSKPERCRALQMKLKLFYDLHWQGSFANEAACLAAVFQSPPEVAFVYVGDSEINAFFLVEQIKARAPDTKIVFLAEKREYALPAFEMGVDNFLLLPPDEERLHNILAQL